MNRLCVYAVAALIAALSLSCKKAGNSEAVEALEKRVAKLEAEQKKMAEIEAFLRPIMEQQKARQAAEEAREPDPNARFAVDISGDFFRGPAGAPVTIVEAFDFA